MSIVYAEGLRGGASEMYADTGAGMRKGGSGGGREPDSSFRNLTTPLLRGGELHLAGEV